MEGYVFKHRPPLLLLENVAALFSQKEVEDGTSPYKLIQTRLFNMGYTVVGDIFNAADFGVPQQRGRAWILCVQTPQLRDASALLKDVTQFHRIYVPVMKCLDLKPPAPTPGKERRTTRKAKNGDNLFLTASELGTCGRPLNDEEIQLPLSKEMLLPESLDCEADLKQAERQRPSQEATQAQKGVSRWIALLSSLVTMADNSLKGKPVIIINLTPYIEDVGVAVFNMRLREQDLKGGFNTVNLFYQSVSWISKEVFGHACLGRELTDAWVNRLFEHGGHKYAVDPPDLTQAESDTIPAAKAAMVSLDEMKFEVLERVNDKMMIRSDEHRFWLAQSGDIKAIYEELRQKHADLIGYQSQHQVAALADADAASASASGSAEESPRVEMESVGKLEQEVGIDLRVSSEVANMELIKCKDNSLWLLSSITKTIAKHTVLGGYGTGQWMTQAECTEPGVPFEIPAGDRTLIQLDEATFGGEGAQGITTLSIYKLLLRAETEKSITNHRVSFLSVRRKEAVEAGQDGFDVSLKQSMVFKCCRDPRADRGDSERITSKNFFSKLISNLPTSLLTTVRYRFERVGQNFKIQRPYVISGKSISLEKDKPLKVA
eukprot:Skav222260  [mRNA]  locus=scaffold2615:8298:18199:+ [translate_table: standard]